MPRAKISINSQHDFITLKLPTGNFTTSYGGAKVSGQLVQMKGAFEALDNYVQTEMKVSNAGKAMQDLMNPDLLDRLVPDWDKPKIVDINVGNMVKFTNDLFAKKYPNSYEVVEVKPKYAYIKVPIRRGEGTETVGFEKHHLEIVPQV